MEVTHDTIFLRGAGIVTLTQPSRGHRFTLDSILLADFCRIKPKDRILEPGGGTGIISLVLAKKFPRAHVTAVELQPSLAAFCEQNIADNDLSGSIDVIGKDLRKLSSVLAPGSFSVIVANPPFIKEGAGRISPLAERHIARHDHAASLGTWLNLHRFLKNGGRYCIVFPAARMAELIARMRELKLEPKRLRLVHPYHEKPASLVLVEAAKESGTGLEVMPPLFVHEPGGGYSREMREIYGLDPGNTE